MFGVNLNRNESVKLMATSYVFYACATTLRACLQLVADFCASEDLWGMAKLKFRAQTTASTR